MTRIWPRGDPIQTRAGPDGLPQTLLWRGAFHQVERVAKLWRVRQKWWAENEAWRDYYKLSTYTGLLLIIYHDLVTDEWYVQRLFD